MFYPYFLLKLAERNPDMQEFFDALRAQHEEGVTPKPGFYPKSIGPFPRKLRDTVLHERNKAYKTDASPNFVITKRGLQHIINRRLKNDKLTVDQLSELIEKLQNGPITYGASLDSKNKSNDAIWVDSARVGKKLPFGVIAPLGTDVSLFTVYGMRPNQIKNKQIKGKITNVTPPLDESTE